MAGEKPMDPTLIAYAILAFADALAKLIQTGQSQTITMDQVLAKAAENQQAHDDLQNQP